MRLTRIFTLAVLAALSLALFVGDASAFGRRNRQAAPASACSSGGCPIAGAVAGTCSPAGYSTCAGGKCELAGTPRTADQFLPAATTEATAPATITSPAQPAAGVADGSDALDEVNAKRASRGLRPYIRDANLTEGARRLAAARAGGLVFGHLQNDFAYIPGSAACTGCAAYPPSYGWMSCAVYDNYTYAGAAWVMGRDGKRYMHLCLR